MPFDSVWTACVNQIRTTQDQMDRLARYAAVAAINIAAMLFMITFAIEFVFHFRPYYWMLLSFCTYLIHVVYVAFMGSTRIAYDYCCLIPTAFFASYDLITSFWSWCILFVAAVPTLMLYWRLRIADPSDSSEGIKETILVILHNLVE